MNEPAVLLLDEPTASLDAKLTRDVEKLVAHYQKEMKAAVLWVSHDPEQLSRVGTRHYLLTSTNLQEQS